MQGERRKRKGEPPKAMSQKYLIETVGCQMNQHDSERMAGLLEQAGYDRTDSDHDKLRAPKDARPRGWRH